MDLSCHGRMTTCCIVHLLNELADRRARKSRETSKNRAQALAREYDLPRNMNETLAVFDKLG